MPVRSASTSARAAREASRLTIPGTTTVAEPVIRPADRKSRRETGRA
jgi:hypothetical protein